MAPLLSGTPLIHPVGPFFLGKGPFDRVGPRLLLRTGPVDPVGPRLIGTSPDLSVGPLHLSGTGPDHPVGPLNLLGTARPSCGTPPPPNDTSGPSHKIPRTLCIPRARKHGWQLLSLYTNLTRPKRPRTVPTTSEHAFTPTSLVDVGQLEAYKSYKRNMMRELRDVDLMEPVGVGWFQRFQENYMELFDTSLLEYQWDRKMLRDADKEVKTLGWKVLKYRWSADDLMTVRGLLPVGNRPWHEVDKVHISCNVGRQHWLLASVDLTTRVIHILDLFRQGVTVSIRKRQV
ncbi:hypothetical protein Ddye_000502 [Dipteronia dyeriana]|uniref:Uncharacterized protein n=1 Tax=Dipteronia dyeriana TaxID=168575 RepID=A0AAD9XN48_9ROSI|nr:hypothetical protein Ddye_000502 [Dipteronia dyeriana]